MRSTSFCAVSLRSFPLRGSLVAMFLLLLAFSGPSWGQSNRGTINGTVSDPSGAPIAEAQVMIRQVSTGEAFELTTGKAGEYDRPGLPVGDYEITFTAKGFSRLVRSGITLRVTDVLRVDAALQLGSVAETVEVNETVTRISSDSAEVGTALDNKALVELPLSFGSGGRRPDAFAFQVTPGVSGTAGANQSHINGSTSYSKEMLVDGASVTVNQAGDTGAAIISPEALQEVKVQTAGLSAEFGRTQGGIFNYVMKSGTNQLHGSAYFGLRNEAFNANTFTNKFRGISRSLDRKMDYAMSGGGPVVLPKLYNGHNKTFWYFTYERYRERSPSLGTTNTSEPIADFYQGDFSRLLGPALSTKDALGNTVLQGAIYNPKTFRQLPNGRWIGDVFPGNRIPVSQFSQIARNLNAIATAHYLPTVTGPDGRVALQNNFYFPTSAQPIWDRYQFAEKGDHIFNERHRIALSVSSHYSPRLLLDSNGLWDPSDTYGGPLSKARKRGETGQIARLIEDWTITPSLLNNVNFSFNHRGNPNAVTQTGTDGAAALGIKNLSTIGYPAIGWGGGPFVTTESPGFIRNSYRSDMSFGLSDTLSASKGRHFLKAGIDIRRLSQNNQTTPNTAINFAARTTAIPNEAFSGTQTGYAFASYLLGIVDNATQSDSVSLGMRRHYVGAFVQDTFKVNRNLTLNYGLRWDYQPPGFEAHDRLSSFNPDKIDPLSGLRGAYDFAGNCTGCTGRSYFGRRDYKDFGPRFGFAWNGPAKIVFRGAYGILYEGDVFNATSTANATPYGKATNVQTGGTYSLDANAVTPWAGIFNWDTGFPTDRYTGAGYDVSWGDKNRPAMFDPHYGLSPYIQQWNLNIQREIMKHTVLDIGYIGNKGTRLRIGELAVLNQIPASALAQYGTKLNNAIRSEADAKANGIAYPYPGFLGTVASALRPFPQVQGNQTIQDYGAPLGFSTYHALQVTLNREVREGLLIYANYVFSKTLANVDSSLLGDNTGRPLDYYNLKLEKSVAEGDQPHMFKAYVNYALPFKGKRFTKALVSGWSVISVVNYYSGQPLTFTATTPLSGGWNGATNRANVAAGELKNPAFDFVNFNLANTLSAQNTYLNKAAFSAPAPLTLGTGARRYSQIRGFGTRSEDISIRKMFQLREKTRFQLTAEMLNVFNRHQLGGIVTSVNSTNFGQVTTVTGNRQIQLSGRIDF